MPWSIVFLKSKKDIFDPTPPEEVRVDTAVADIFYDRLYSQGPVLYTPPVLYTLQCKVPQESSSCKILLTYIITMYRLILL